jgi:putative intracellular protease/amidase
MRPTPLHIFVFDTMADWETPYVAAGVNQPAFQVDPGRYTVRTAGLTLEPVLTLGGLRIVPDMTLAEVAPEQSAMLVLPGGNVWDEGGHPEAVELASRFLAAGVPVAAICGATAGLARAGMLDDRPHTSNAPEYLAALPGYHGHHHYSAEPAVSDGHLITASGTAPVDFARAVFARLELYAPPVLDAWFALYRHGDASGFYALQSQAGAS